jgi:hypothetical protein
VRFIDESCQAKDVDSRLLQKFQLTVHQFSAGYSRAGGFGLSATHFIFYPEKAMINTIITTS